MRRRSLLLVLAVALFTPAVAAAQAETDPAKAPRVSVADLKKLQASGTVTVVDVRSAESFTEGHIPGALSIPLAQVEASVARLRNAKKPLVFYCA
jgi:rhodanese-related sulfurtransferase